MHFIRHAELPGDQRPGLFTQPAADESDAVFAPPPTPDPSRRGSPPDARRVAKTFVDRVDAPRKKFGTIKGGYFAVFMNSSEFIEEMSAMLSKTVL
jgi:hypothetical protein